MRAKPEKYIIGTTEARNELPNLIRRIRKLHNRYFITKQGRVEAVLMSAEEFESWRETIDILSNKAEIRALKRGEKEIKKGKGRSFEEVFGEKL